MIFEKYSDGYKVIFNEKGKTDYSCEIIEWCRENLETNNWFANSSHCCGRIRFSELYMFDATDALIFKLTWYGVTDK